MPGQNNALKCTTYLNPEATKYLVSPATRLLSVCQGSLHSLRLPLYTQNLASHTSSLTDAVDYLLPFRMRINTNINDQMVRGAASYGRRTF